MDIVYFYDESLKHCPVKEYLKQYLPTNKDKRSVILRKQKILASIGAKIEYIRDNGGKPIPPISKPLHGYSCFEILNSKIQGQLLEFFILGIKINGSSSCF